MGHSHNHSTNHKDRNLLISILLNSMITIAQIIGGFLSGSLALLSDALHNLTDVFSLIISYIASILSKKKATNTRTFGYKRAEIIAAFINASSLIVIAIYLVFEAINRFFNPQKIEAWNPSVLPPIAIRTIIPTVGELKTPLKFATIQ